MFLSSIECRLRDGLISVYYAPLDQGRASSHAHPQMTDAFVMDGENVGLVTNSYDKLVLTNGREAGQPISSFSTPHTPDPGAYTTPLHGLPRQTNRARGRLRQRFNAP